MLEKIEMLMEERGLKNNKAALSKGADIPYTTVTGLWEKGVENARRKTLKKLSAFFDVSMEYLINDDEEDRNYGKINPLEFTREEHHLVYLWRQLPRDEQMKILGRVEAKVEEGPERQV